MTGQHSDTSPLLECPQTWVDEEVAQKPCCCLPGLAGEVVEPLIVAHAGGDAPSGDLDASRLPCAGHSGLLPIAGVGCPMLASSGSTGAALAAAPAADAGASGVLVSSAAAEGTLLMLLGVLGSDCPCNHQQKSGSMRI